MQNPEFSWWFIHEIKTEYETYLVQKPVTKKELIPSKKSQTKNDKEENKEENLLDATTKPGTTAKENI